MSLNLVFVLNEDSYSKDPTIPSYDRLISATLLNSIFSYSSIQLMFKRVGIMIGVIEIITIIFACILVWFLLVLRYSNPFSRKRKLIREKKHGKAEKGTNEETTTDENRDTTGISDLLDFHSDRAVAHASFFLASIFGLFTVLSIAQNSPENSVLWALPYWALFLIGLYSFANFCLYAIFANRIEQQIRGNEQLPGPETHFIGFFFRLKGKMRKWQLKGHAILTPLMLLLYFFIATVSSYLVLGAETTFAGVI